MSEKYFIVIQPPKSISLDNSYTELTNDIEEYLDIKSNLNNKGYQYIIFDISTKQTFTSKTRGWNND